MAAKSWGVVCFFLLHACAAQRRLGAFREVFAWKQLTYDIDGSALQDRFGFGSSSSEEDGPGHFDYHGHGKNFNEGHSGDSPGRADPDAIYFDYHGNNWNHNYGLGQNFYEDTTTVRPAGNRQNFNEDTTTVRPADERNRSYVQYNNVPMGVERVGDRLFVTVPRRRYGIPSTLNYIDLKTASNTRSPPLKPYPNIRQSQSLTSVYRTRADECGRLWMVDTGLLEVPGVHQQIQPPAIVVFDLNTNQQILRYTFKSSDIPATTTSAGLASITVDTSEGCANTYAYATDLATYGIIVYSLRENDSWRLSHNYFYLTPTAGHLRIAGQYFQWSDGIFSITLSEQGTDGCRTAYFHPLISMEEFSVSTCLLKNKTASQDINFFTRFSKVGVRGEDNQCTMHGYHQGTRVIFFAEVGRDSVSCWNSRNPLRPSNVAILVQDRERMSYPSDLHVTGDEVWVMANKLPRFGYSSLDVNQYNFYIYSGNVRELISGTICDNGY